MTSQSFYPPQCACGAHQKLLHQCTSQTFQTTTGLDSSQWKKSCFTYANHKHQGHPDFTQTHPQVTNWLDSLLKDVTSVVWMRAMHVTILMCDCTNRSFELQQLGSFTPNHNWSTPLASAGFNKLPMCKPAPALPPFFRCMKDAPKYFANLHYLETTLQLDYWKIHLMVNWTKPGQAQVFVFDLRITILLS
jgi:hypothetical protein